MGKVFLERFKYLAIYRRKKLVGIKTLCNLLHLLMQVGRVESVGNKNRIFDKYDWLQKLNTKGFYTENGGGEVK